MELRQVGARETEQLRREVLRSGRPVALPGDDDPTVLHLGLFDGPLLLATGNIRREPLPWDPAVAAWRVRGMATVPDRRGEGLGAQVLAGLLRHARESGGGPVWLNARTPARSFYERAGFVVTGEPWEDPEIGPHVRMWCQAPGGGVSP